MTTRYKPINARIDRIEQALAKAGGDAEVAAILLSDVPEEEIRAVWERMQDTVYPTDEPGHRGRPRSGA